MINKLWVTLISVGSICMILSGNIDVLNKQILGSGEVAFKLLMKLFPLISLWLGIMRIASDSGLLKKLSKLLEPILVFLFPDVSKDDVAFEYISSNIVANMLGLGNAATPFGLKAMKELKKISGSDTASNSMITFLVINTCGLTIIPTTIMALRLMYGSNNPSSIILPCFIVSFLSLFFGLLLDRLWSKR
ncbi:MAG: spore maturation protein [Bacilli bacterium]|nr:spore maturation protein [Bacilli bacterium]